MTRVRAIGVALVAVVALSAAAASVATAVEGPFYKVEGSRLLAGETRVLLASASKPFALTGNSGSIVITCTGLNLPVANERQIIGSTGANPGKSLEVLDFTGCTVTGNGTKCDVVNELVITNLVANLLGYSKSDRTGLILVAFVPDSGNDFASINFVALTGGSCTFPSALVEGSVVGLARVNGTPIEVGSEPAETLHGEVSFAGVNKTIWMENGTGELHSLKAGLKAFGLAATLTGTALLLVDLASGPVNWGVFTA